VDHQGDRAVIARKIVIAPTYTNGHHKAAAKPEPEPDPDPPEEPKPCSLRLGYGSWCFLPDGHEGDHEGAPAMYGPVEERPTLWRRHKGQQK
jgi:hypothetical protein